MADGKSTKAKRVLKSKAVSKSADKPRRPELLARCAVLPEMRHAAVARRFGNPMLNIDDDESEWKDTVTAFSEETNLAAAGKLGTVSRVLISQALTLDAIFTRMASRAIDNLSEYPEATEHYMRLALKAQANSRATLEALARMHQPREQTVKHVTVNEGGQAVVADSFHHHRGGQNEETNDQPHEPITALPGLDPLRGGVPISRNEGQEAVPVARRQVAWRADGVG